MLLRRLASARFRFNMWIKFNRWHVRESRSILAFGDLEVGFGDLIGANGARGRRSWQALSLLGTGFGRGLRGLAGPGDPYRALGGGAEVDLDPLEVLEAFLGVDLVSTMVTKF